MFVLTLIEEAFCENPLLGLEEDQLAYCKEVIKGFIPPAIKTLMTALIGARTEICTAWYDGICGVRTTMSNPSTRLGPFWVTFRYTY